MAVLKSVRFRAGILGTIVGFVWAGLALGAEVKTEAELGWILTGGNSETNTFSVKDQNVLTFDQNEIRFDGRFLSTSAGATETARNWGFGLRYSRSLSSHVSLFVSQGVEGNSFAGFWQRYGTDVGAKVILLSEEQGLDWAAEAGYRFLNENTTSNTRLSSHAARLYTEGKKAFSKAVSAKLWVEFIPNFTNGANWLLNSEVSLAVLLSEVFSLKMGYLLKYDAELNPGVSRNLDTALTSALVAKF